MPGYSVFTARDIQRADGRLLGVKLGRLCVERAIPVTEVAEYLKVSRMTVYNWFKGTVDVSYKHEAQVESLIKRLS
jgi:predicted transcriptional regulator